MVTDGDPKLYLAGCCNDLHVTDGQPVMDSGLENAVLLSLFTPAGWWGNAISPPSGKFTSQLQTVARRTLNNKTRLDAEAYARDALAWMIADGAAKSITVESTLPAVNILGLIITITKPDNTLARYTVNWDTLEARAT